MIPDQIQSLRLVSRRCHPFGPGYRSPRGVLVGKMTFFNSQRSQTINAHCTQNDLDGWCEKTEKNCRWTSGNALLPLGEQEMLNPGVLSVEILSDGPYVEDIERPPETPPSGAGR